MRCSKRRWLWRKFRGGCLWRMLRSIPLLRSALYFAIQLRATFMEDEKCGVVAVDEPFRKSVDPWDYENSPIVHDLFTRETDLLDSTRNGALFRKALEIGCAEGCFTELLADRCESLTVLELSPTALERARTRRLWPTHVHFSSFDLRRDSIPGHFDLVVVAGVLEYFSRRRTFFAVREKLVAATTPGGHLLIETTRPPPVVDDSWWARYLVRGRWINTFMARHPALTTVHTFMNDLFVITLYRRAQSERKGQIPL